MKALRGWLLALAAMISTPLQAESRGEQIVTLKDFRFANGEKMDLRLHVTTLGTPHRGADGKIDNAVMILHGTGGSARQFFTDRFSGELFGRGQPLDTARWYLILPDSIGHGRSSKPSDGLRMRFPRYGYADMVAAQHRLLTEALGVDRLELILGTSMGCMHAFVWGTSHPGFARRLAPFACNAVEIGGRNRLWRQMAITAIKADPAWHGGLYKAQPAQGLRTARYLGTLAGSNTLALQQEYPTARKTEAYLAAIEAGLRHDDGDANDLIYQLDASSDYDPAPQLAAISVPVLWINSADDFINPPELGLAQQQVKQMPAARLIVIPASPETKGHGTHTWARFWKEELARFLGG